MNIAFEHTYYIIYGHFCKERTYMNQLKKEVCAYIRVSSHGQEDYSPDAQLRLINEYAESHDMIITGVYQDLGISGRSADKRTEFINMIADCKDKSHPYDAILVWKFSRFARNQDESIVYKSLLKKEKVDVISISEPIPEGFAGGLIERILEWMDEYYSIRLSGEVRRGMTQKALKGGYNAQPPIGYIKERGPHTIPQIDSKYAEMVRMIYHMIAIEKESILHVARTINDMGYRTRRGNLWESRDIRYIIQNPFYIGKIRWNNTARRSHKEIVGETIITPGKHEPLVSEELWNEAQLQLQNRALKYKPGNMNVHKNTRHWLAGILKCPYCGATLAYSNVRGYESFKCYKRVKGQCTTNPIASIAVTNAEKSVLDGLKIIIEDKKLEKIDKIPTATEKDPSKNIRDRISYLTRCIDRLRQSYLAGIDSIEEYKESRLQIKKEIDELQSKLEKTEYTEDSPQPVSLEQFENVYEYLSSEGSTPEIIEKKAEAIRTIVDHIVYHKDTDTMEFFLLRE